MTTVKFKGSPIRLYGALPQLHTLAPDFCLVDTDLKEWRLSDFKGKKKLFSIVPSLDTGVCLTSSKKFNAMFKDHPNVIGIVISADLPFAQKRLCNQENLNNLKTLSVMRSQNFGKDYGVLIEEGPLAGICSRAVFVIDEKDAIIYRELVPEITHEPDYDKAFSALLT